MIRPTEEEAIRRIERLRADVNAARVKLEASADKMTPEEIRATIEPLKARYEMEKMNQCTPSKTE